MKKIVVNGVGLHAAFGQNFLSSTSHWNASEASELSEAVVIPLFQSQLTGHRQTRRTLSVLDFYDVPLNSVVLLYGPPGSGKSTFCEDVAVSWLRSRTRPIIYFTTELMPQEIIQYFSSKGIGSEQLKKNVWIVDGSQPIPTSSPTQNILPVDCTDLTGMGVKLAELQSLLGGQNDILLIFDSLSSPYLFNGNTILKFIRQTLGRFALNGNRVLASIDEGCGKKEDLVALQSISNGIIRIEPKKDKRVMNIMKFPGKKPLSFDYVLKGGIEPVPYSIDNSFTDQWMRTREKTLSGTIIRENSSGDSVNLIWFQLALWGGMLWDKRFPALMYNFGKDLSFQLTLQIMPNIVSQNPKLKNENDMIEYVSALNPVLISATKKLGGSDLYFIEQISHKDEIHYGWNESAICFAFPNVNSALCYFYSGTIAGAAKAVSTFLGKPKSWDATEYMCLGLGNETCRARVVETGSDDLRGYLESIDNVRIERLNDRINEQMASHLLQRKPPVERRKLGVEMQVAHFQESITLPSLSCDFFRRALSNAGLNSGMKLAGYLQERGLSSDEAIRQLGNFLSYAKVGQVTLGENLRIVGNAETLGLSSGLPICSFTTGFLSGFASVVKSARVVENSCQTSGSEYCEFVFTRV